MDEGFRGPQVCKIVGITYRQLDYWARTDLIRPSIADAKGSGTQRRYSYRDLVELKVIKGLLDAGVALQTARKAVEYLRTTLGDDIASRHPRHRRVGVGAGAHRRRAGRPGAQGPGRAQHRGPRRREGGARRRHHRPAGRRAQGVGRAPGPPVAVAGGHPAASAKAGGGGG